MNVVVQIGPLAIAIDRLLAVAAIWAFLALIPWLLRRDEERPWSIAWLALAIDAAAARLGYGAQHWAIFSEDPFFMTEFMTGKVKSDKIV